MPFNDLIFVYFNIFNFKIQERVKELNSLKIEQINNNINNHINDGSLDEKIANAIHNNLHEYIVVNTIHNNIDYHDALKNSIKRLKSIYEPTYTVNSLMSD